MEEKTNPRAVEPGRGYSHALGDHIATAIGVKLSREDENTLPVKFDPDDDGVVV